MKGNYGCFFGSSIKSAKDCPCWSPIMSFYKMIGTKFLSENADNTIFIGNYDYIETRKYQKLLIETINEITPCVFEQGFIKFKLLKTYDQSLILLNFIRNLWYVPDDMSDYTQTFFEELQKSKYKDPLKKLTSANILAGEGKIAIAGHCNIRGICKIKSTKDLLKYTNTSTTLFLTT